jgi:hypothetical protein
MTEKSLLNQVEPVIIKRVKKKKKRKEKEENSNSNLLTVKKHVDWSKIYLLFAYTFRLQ